MRTSIDYHEDNGAIVVECDPGLDVMLLRSEIC